MVPNLSNMLHLDPFHIQAELNSGIQRVSQSASASQFCTSYAHITVSAMSQY
jgi:hypothetical protein